ncbi:thioredoxin-2-like protein [Leptotrombidium deliense]|uniref:Thioredoxin-2-like protein n=1 Tax=Leptotrombidium deliense TaxID=299467 RepID=A0A443QP80_9ACAR|nr:thioredoxin-2-like protein [Leptotrombidium deliense]
MGVTKIESREQLKSQLLDAGNNLVVIYFYAEWNFLSISWLPKIENISSEFADSVTFLKINVDECAEVAEDYEVTSMPNFVFIKASQIVEKYLGNNEKRVKKLVQKYK